MTDPLSDSKTFAEWAAERLQNANIDAIAQWRMLEYWMQVELYRAVRAGFAGSWQYLGQYEQPYFTHLPRSGRKSKWKFIDLVLAEPNILKPNRVAWIELKDLGRSHERLAPNSKGLGSDLAALVALDPVETAEGWLNPPGHVVDKGRFPEWRVYAHGLCSATHLIAQLVLVPRVLINDFGEGKIVEIWTKKCHERIKQLGEGMRPESNWVVSRCDTGNFAILAMIGKPLPQMTVAEL